MPSLQLENTSLSYGDRDILSSVSMSLSDKSRTALAGANGSGKSTLMKIICGQIEPDGGLIHKTRDSRISYLPQSDYVFMDSTVYLSADSAFTYFHDLQEKLKELEKNISDNTHSASSRLSALLSEHHDLHEKILASGYYQRETRIYQVLQGLGFSKEDISRPCSEFSGGWQMRIALARTLLGQSDFLLLDEPTNYLDVEARVWLKNYLARYKGGIFIVSHDRDFLDETVLEVLEIFNGAITRYAGNYSSYELQRNQRTEQLIQQYTQQQEEIKRIELFIDRFRYKESKARQVQSRIVKLEKIEKIEIPENLKKISFTFPPSQHSGKQIFTIDKLSKSYDQLKVLSDLSFSMTRGDRLAVTGRNGAGKSTLLRILSEIDTDFQGSKINGTGLSIGYFAQDSDKMLDISRTAYEEIESTCPTQLIPKLRSYLGSFLFRGDDIYKKTEILSGGEKSRLSLLKLLLKPHNVLILDEPTNHLDIAAKDVLLEALQSFTGTLIFVSHDSYFIRNLATRIMYMSESGVEMFEGDYDYFSWVLENRNQYITDDSKKKELPGSNTSPINTATVTEVDWKTRNSIRNKIKSLQKQEEQILLLVEQCDIKIEKLTAAMSDPDNYQYGDKMKPLVNELEGSKSELQEQMNNWESVRTELEELSINED
ncbi:MAG: ABC-F family ATP-binding cassette domain-containing protein [Bacteroidetes bacterium]|nr:ABC-F family ATP-binding cassette domain-containing protein [Bacteroidota bacterium]